MLDCDDDRYYYHLSPHIRAHVLCAPPRARYVFLNLRRLANHQGLISSSVEGGTPQSTQKFEKPVCVVLVIITHHAHVNTSHR